MEPPRGASFPTSHERHEPVLELSGISKRFPGALVLDAIDLEVAASSIHALVGENGAGKSTLLKGICGAIPFDDGSMKLDGSPFSPRSVVEARDEGVGMLFQESTLQPMMTVAENFAFPTYEHARGITGISKRRILRHAKDVLAEFGWATNPEDLVRDLPLGARRLLDLVVVLRRQPKVILVDEITASMSRDQVDQATSMLLAQRDKGAAILYVSHHLEEIFEFCDSTTVLRDGRVVARHATAHVDTSLLAREMVGREFEYELHKGELPKGTIVFEAQQLTGSTFFDIDLTVRENEIVGVAGLSGSGAEELIATIFGDLPVEGGEMELDGRPYSPRSPRDAVRCGVGFVPGDRDSEGLVPEFKVWRNATLPSAGRWRSRFLIRHKLERRATQEIIDELGVRPSSPMEETAELSGGNRQKVVIGKWLLVDPRFLVLMGPTRGVDVGAKAQIYATLSALRENRGVLIYSDELPELIALCDQIVVVRRGRISLRVEDGTATEHDLVGAML